MVDVNVNVNKCIIYRRTGMVLVNMDVNYPILASVSGDKS